MGVLETLSRLQLAAPPRSTSRRRQARFALTRRIYCAYMTLVSGLMFLVGHRGSAEFRMRVSRGAAAESATFPSPFSVIWSASPRVSPAALRVHRRLYRCARDQVCRRHDKSAGVDFWSEAAYQVPAPPAVSINVDLVDLPLRPPPTAILDHLPPELVSAFGSDALVRPPDESLPRLRPARFFGSNDQFVRFVRRLLDAGLARVLPEHEVRCRVGVFGRIKPATGRQRVIYDARAANRLFPLPRELMRLRLPTLEHLAELEVPAGESLVQFHDDLSDYFYSLGTPDWMHAFFVLPQLTPAQARATGLFDGTAPVSVGLTTLPMGWAHACLCAQLVHQNVLRRSLRDSLLLSPDMPFPHLLDNKTVVMLFIDDAHGVGLAKNTAPVAELQQQLAVDYAVAGQVPKASKHVPATTGDAAVYGARLDGRSCRLSADPDKLARACADTRRLLSRPRVSGRQVHSVVGQWVWLMMPVRAALSVFRAVYAFIGRYPSSPAVLWDTARDELTAAMNLGPLLCAQLDAPWCPFALAVDASDTGAGVCGAPIDAGTARTLARDMPAVPDAAQVDDARRAFPGAALDWKTWIAHKWRWPATSEGENNRLELHALLLGVRRALTSPAAWGARLLFFSDNTAVLGGVRRGRSSAKFLRNGLRELAMYCLVSGLRLYGRYVATEHNPADGPSRLH